MSGEFRAQSEINGETRRPVGRKRPSAPLRRCVGKLPGICKTEGNSNDPHSLSGDICWCGGTP